MKNQFFIKSQLLIIILLFVSQNLLAQSANLMIQEPNYESIVVYLDGQKQNHSAQPQVHLTNLAPGYFRVEVTCLGTTIIQEQITLTANTESVYEVQKKNGYNQPSHFLKRISVFPITEVALDDRGTTSANFQSLENAIKNVKEEVFFADGFTTKDAWEGRMLSQARTLKYYDCLANQIETVVSLKDEVFFAEGMTQKAAWAKRMVEKIISNPTYDCSIPNKMRAIANGKSRSGAFGMTEQAAWARGEIEKML